MIKIKEPSLYLLITSEYCRNRSAVDVAREAISGGVDIIQLREKNILRSGVAEMARLLAALCKKNKVVFIVNDDPILAKEVDADGVHLGQEDLRLFTVVEARKMLGKNKIIGVSAGSISDVERANKADIDYVGFGPIFRTTVKKKCIGVKDVEKALKVSKSPVFFIGGINSANIDKLLTKGARNIAVIRAITEADNIKNAAGELKNMITGAGNGKITRAR